MRNLLLAASALSLAMVAGTAGVEAAGPWVNVAVNAPWAEIDGSVDITAQRGGTIGHVGWHEGNQGRSRHNPIGEIETPTRGAINGGLSAVGREGFEYDNLTAAVGAVGGYSSDFNYSHGGYSSDQFFGPYRSGHYSSLNDSEEGWFAAGGYLDAVSIEAEGVPSGIAVNAAVNLADIDARATIAA